MIYAQCYRTYLRQHKIKQIKLASKYIVLALLTVALLVHLIIKTSQDAETACNRFKDEYSINRCKLHYY